MGSSRDNRRKINCQYEINMLDWCLFFFFFIKRFRVRNQRNKFQKLRNFWTENKLDFRPAFFPQSCVQIRICVGLVNWTQHPFSGVWTQISGSICLCQGNWQINANLRFTLYNVLITMTTAITTWLTSREKDTWPSFGTFTVGPNRSI